MDRERDLALARLALQQKLVDPHDLLKLLDSHWQDESSGSLADRLVDSGRLPASERPRFESAASWAVDGNRETLAAGAWVPTDSSHLGFVEASVYVPMSRGTAGLEPGDATTAWDVPADGVPGSLGRGSSPAPDRPSDRYQILHSQGRGGIGQIWLAHDRLLDRRVAMKELRPDRGSAILLAKLLDEARITGRLEHPSIVPVYDLVLVGAQGLPFFIMRFIDGQTLAQAIRDHHRDRGKVADPAGRAVWFDLLNAFTAICNAVGYAHEQRVLHRDLKPQNVMIGRFGEVFVLDWGLAKRTEVDPLNPAAGATASDSLYPMNGPGGSPASTFETAAGRVLGTPAYIPPEQALGQVDRIDARTDVYGLGAILYEILTGRPPYLGLSPAETVELVLKGPPAPPRTIDPSVPRALDAICRKALAPERTARYQSAGELAADVRRWLADEPVSVDREPALDRLVRWARAHRSLVAGVLASLVVLAAALAVGNVLLSREKAIVVSARDSARADYQTARDLVQKLLGQMADEELATDPRLDEYREHLLSEAVRMSQFFESRNPGPQEFANSAEVAIRLANLTISRRGVKEGLSRLVNIRIPLRDHVSRFPEDFGLRDRLALVNHSGAEALLEAGQLHEVPDWLDEAMQQAQSAHDARPNDPIVGRTLGQVRLLQARFGNASGQSATAQAAAREAVRLLEAFRDPRSSEIHHFLIPQAQLELGLAQLAAGDVPAAITTLRQARDRADALLAENPGQPAPKLFHARVRLRLARLAAADARFRDDPAALRSELEAFARDLAPPAVPLMPAADLRRLVPLAQVEHALALLDLDEDHLPEADSGFSQAIRELEARRADAPDWLPLLSELGQLHADRARLADRLNRDAQARSDRVAARELLQAVLTREPTDAVATAALQTIELPTGATPTRP